MAEGERPQERIQRRGRVGPGEDPAHPAMTQQRHVIDRAAPATMPATRGPPSIPRSRPLSLGTLRCSSSQVAQPGPVGKGARTGDQAAGRHEIRIVERHRGSTGYARVASEALPRGWLVPSPSPKLPAQGLRVTARSTPQSPIGGSGQSGRNWPLSPGIWPDGSGVTQAAGSGRPGDAAAPNHRRAPPYPAVPARARRARRPGGVRTRGGAARERPHGDQARVQRRSGAVRADPPRRRPAGVAVLVHGGFWPQYGIEYAQPLVPSLVAAGWATWAIEYRRGHRRRRHPRRRRAAIDALPVSGRRSSGSRPLRRRSIGHLGGPRRGLTTSSPDRRARPARRTTTGSGR